GCNTLQTTCKLPVPVEAVGADLGPGIKMPPGSRTVPVGLTRARKSLFLEAQVAVKFVPSQATAARVNASGLLLLFEITTPFPPPSSTTPAVEIRDPAI